MIDFSLSEEERAVRDTIRQFIQQEVMPLETQVLRNERAGLPPLEPGQLKELQAQGQGKAAGGASTPPRSTAAWPSARSCPRSSRWRPAARSCRSGSAARPTTSSSPPPTSRSSSTSSPRSRASAAAASRSPSRARGPTPATSGPRAVKDGDDWVINGEKTFITGGNEADFVMVFAVTDKEKGADGGVTCFLVDRDMGWKSEPIPTMGEWGPASLVVRGRPGARTRTSSARSGTGFELAMQWIGNGPLHDPGPRARLVPSGCVEMAMEHAKNRVTFGAADRQLPGDPVDDRRLRRRDRGGASWLVLHAAWQVRHGIDSRQPQSMAKLYGGVKANEIVDRVLQIHGGMGYTRELPIERWYRELRLLRIYEGTDEIQRRTIARNLLKGHVKLGQIGD